MSDRVCLGARNETDSGLFISVAGINVLTATDQQLIFNSNIAAFQFIQTGKITGGALPGHQLTIPNQGFYPLICFFVKITDLQPNDYNFAVGESAVKYNSYTSVNFAGSAGFQGGTSEITYAVTRTPINV